MRIKIGLIGFGNMGSAIYERAKDAFDFIVLEKEAARTAGLDPAQIENDLHRLVSRVEALVLAVKPQDFPALLGGLDDIGDITVISIAAGITTEKVESALARSGAAHVVRVMPNLAVKVGKGMSCICRGSRTRQKDLSLAESLFKKAGHVLVIEEALMDAATAISGSGPGFFCEMVEGKSLHEAQNFGRHIFMPELQACAVQAGFTPRQAALLSAQTTAGAVELMKVSGCAAAELRDRVASKGGTTEAGLTALRQTHSLAEAVRAALERARQLAK